MRVQTPSTIGPWRWTSAAKADSSRVARNDSSRRASVGASPAGARSAAQICRVSAPIRPIALAVLSSLFPARVSFIHFFAVSGSLHSSDPLEEQLQNGQDGAVFIFCLSDV